ncbi:protein phosphatase methylesterase 1 isoform X2 [Plutella xylostella]|uniref:protein phosphatase methylesterase 1 isoform X2 n=1 Tax=Plutella xylostella TaxID=51655 RepID=UPI002033003E|nr:protein phosphatase methylesterase 1 isoform X2 [Plutella xylostella]
MSALQKSIMKTKLPPKCPRTSGISKLAPFGTSRRKDYRPVSWQHYFAKCEDVQTDSGKFRVYMSPEPDHPERPRIVTLHGGGYSGLSWALFTEEITNMIHCQVISMDLRGHGETEATEPDDLNGETLVKDVEQVLHKLFNSEIPPIILVGHSMGGAVAVRAAHLPSLEHCIQGIAVIDVVEGTAMDALASMQSFLRGRPTHFKSIEHAIEWCVRSGQVRNVESAKVSMPGQIVNCATNKLAINEVPLSPPSPPGSPPAAARGARGGGDAIPEDEVAEVGEMPPPPDSAMNYKWRIDLSLTERHWAGWFSGLSTHFLTLQYILSY